MEEDRDLIHILTDSLKLPSLHQSYPPTVGQRGCAGVHPRGLEIWSGKLSLLRREFFYWQCHVIRPGSFKACMHHYSSASTTTSFLIRKIYVPKVPDIAGSNFDCVDPHPTINVVLTPTAVGWLPKRPDSSNRQDDMHVSPMTFSQGSRPCQSWSD